VRNTPPPPTGGVRRGAAARYEERGSGDLALLPELGEGGQPISSRALPFVSFTYLSTNGMESAAKIV
jgi:hypothetical protein